MHFELGLLELETSPSPNPNQKIDFFQNNRLKKSVVED